MKDIYNICAWNMRRSIKYLGINFVVFAICETLFTFLLPDGSGGSVMRHPIIMFIFFLSFVSALLISAVPSIGMAFGKAHADYTVMMLPIKRSKVLYGNILTGILYEISAMCVQLLMFVVLYYPLRFIQPSKMFANTVFVDGERITTTVEKLHSGLFLHFVGNTFSDVLFPHSIIMFIAVALAIIASAITLHCILMHTKGARLLAFTACIATGVCGVGGIMIPYFNGRFAARGFTRADILFCTFFVCQIVIAALSLWWAINAMNKAKNL